MAIARSPELVLDCPDAAALADFYGELLGWSVDPDEGDATWVVLNAPVGPDGSAPPGMRVLCFQQVEGYRPPDWPGQERPQQTHLDVEVDDLDAGESAVLGIGARKAEHQPGETFRVFLDPAGHPFCLCQA